MLFVKYGINTPKETLLSVLSDNNLVAEAENFDTSSGKPRMNIKQKGDKLKIKCVMTERATKDNGFLEGTYFIGKIKEKEGRTSLNGIILTAPIYHTLFLILFAFFIFQCIRLGGISPIPIILAVFDVVMFWSEFKKQGIIKRYIFRAFKIVFKQNNPNILK